MVSILANSSSVRGGLSGSLSAAAVISSSVMASSRASSSALIAGGLLGSSLYLTIGITALLRAICATGRDDAVPAVAKGKDHAQHAATDPAYRLEAVLAVVSPGDIENDAVRIAKDSHRKCERHTVRDEVNGGFCRCPSRTPSARRFTAGVYGY